MNVVQLVCAGAGTLLYEPDGVLLRSCLIPVNGDHTEHLLTFQLGYLGPGEIKVVVILEGGPEGQPPARTVEEATLWGTGLIADDFVHMPPPSPSVFLTYARAPHGPVSYRYTVLSDPDSRDGKRGELVTEVAGQGPSLTATTLAGVTSRGVPDERGSRVPSSCLVHSRSGS